MFDYSLNVAGSEWVIVIFIALVLLLGTKKLPDAAKKLGKAVNQYNQAKNEVQGQIDGMNKKVEETTNVNITGPVENERQKLEMIAKSLGINVTGKSDDELREIISSRIGKPSTESNADKE